jgi:ABC-type glycerol-3-phosphate transport system substrate-binding protein
VYHNAFIIWSLAFGGTMWDTANERLTIDQSNNIRAADWIVSYTSQITLPEYLELKNAGGGYPSLFSRGFLSAVLIAPNAILNIYKQNPDIEMAITRPPYMPGFGQPGQTTFVAGPSIGIVRGSRHVEEAWKSLKFMASNTGRNSRDMGVLRDIDRLRRNLVNSPVDLLFAEMLFTSAPVGRPPAPNTSTFYNELIKGFPVILKHEKPTPEVLGEINRTVSLEMERILAAFRY